MRARLIVVVAVVAALLVVSSRGGGAPTIGVPADWIKGFNFTNWSPHSYGRAGAAKSLRRLRATGADAIALIPTWYQSSPQATRIAPDRRRSPTDHSIAVAVRRAKAAGLRVFLRPVVDDQGHTPRLDFVPASPQAWFQSYRAFIYHYARLARRLRVNMLSVGHEYHRLDGPGFTGSWLKVIAGVRRRYHGPITYGANGDDAWTHIGFWKALDVIGIDAYFALSTGDNPSVSQIVSRWHEFTDAGGTTHRYLDRMGALSRRYHKPIVFTEVGYPSTPDALAEPWVSGRSYAADQQERGFEALFQALAGKCWFRGLYIWDWSTDPSAGGRGDGDYTPEGKPAARTIRRWFTTSAPSTAGRRPARCSQ